jgi:hypothetical protein
MQLQLHRLGVLLDCLNIRAFFNAVSGDTQMITRVIAASILGLTSCVAFADIGSTDESATFTGRDFVVADTRGQDRRDDRDDDQDDRKDCRQEEGRVGGDKRDCKQDNRRDGDA